MRPFPSCDRVRGLNISDCPSPESFTCSKGEFLKCTEDDRAWRIRMVAGCPSLVSPFFGQARKVAKDTGLRIDQMSWFVRRTLAAGSRVVVFFLGSSSLGRADMQNSPLLLNLPFATPAARPETRASALSPEVTDRSFCACRPASLAQSCPALGNVKSITEDTSLPAGQASCRLIRGPASPARRRPSLRPCTGNHNPWEG